MSEATRSALLAFLVALTRLRISEALGLKWSDLDYERKMIQLERVWVGKKLVARMKTDGSGRARRVVGRCFSKLAPEYALCEAGRLGFSLYKDEGQNAAERQHDGEG